MNHANPIGEPRSNPPVIDVNDPAQVTTKQSNCRCCIAGCGIVAEVVRDTVVAIRGDRSHPMSQGYVCPKGYSLAWSQHRKDRLDYPSVRGQRVSWPDALDDLAAQFERIRARHGNESIGWYEGTGTATDTLGKVGLHTLMAGLGSTQRYSAVTIDVAPAYRVAELVTGTHLLQPRWVPEDDGKLVIFWGTNPLVSHAYISYLSDPTRRLKRFRARGGEAWVVDPKATKTASRSDGHLPIWPGTDHFLLAWLINSLLESGAASPSFLASTTDDDRAQLQRIFSRFTLARACQETRLAPQALSALLESIRSAGRIAIVSGTGVMHQKDALLAEWLRWVLLLLTDSLDEPGGMWFNPGWFESFDQLDEPLSRNKNDEHPPSSPEALARVAGEVPVASMISQMESGQLRGLVVSGGNPMSAFPDQLRAQRALSNLDLLVVADVVGTSTTAVATHVLPMAGQLERTDVLASRSEYAMLAPAVVRPGGERRPMWWVAAEIAQRLSIRWPYETSTTDWTDESVALQHRLRQGRGDIGNLVEAGSHGLQVPRSWGFMRARVLQDGRWSIVDDDLIARLEACSARPDSHVRLGTFRLVNGRQLSRNNSTSFVPPEHPHRRALDRAVSLINPADANRLEITPGDHARVRTPAGALVVTVEVDESIRPNTLYIPHGYPETNVADLIGPELGVDLRTGQAPMTAVEVTLEKWVECGQTD